MLRRLLLPLVLSSVACFLPACGDDTAEAVDVEALLARLLIASEEDAGPIAEQIGAVAAEDPELLDRLVAMMRADEPNVGQVTLALEVRDAADLPDDDARRVATRRAVEIMAFRLRSYGHAPGTFDLKSGMGDIQVTVPKPRVPADMDAEARAALDDDYGKILLRHLTAPGRIELLLVVPRPEEGAEPASLWTASPEAYDTFVAKAAADLDAAVKDGVLYAPEEPGFVLAAVPPTAGSAEHGHLVVLRSANAAEYFDRDDLTLKPTTLTAAGDLGLEMSVTDEQREAVEAWSRTHKGRDMVLVVNGVAGTPLRIDEPIQGTIVIPYGAKDDPAGVAALESVGRVLVSRAHPNLLTGRRVRDVPPEALTPATMALIASGNEGAKRMSQLRAEGGNIGARAARVLELIARRRTSGGDRFVPGNNEQR